MSATRTNRPGSKTLSTAKGTLKTIVPISGTIAPGFVQRHVVHPSSTIEQPPGLAVALHFALAALCLAIDRKMDRPSSVREDAGRQLHREGRAIVASALDAQCGTDSRVDGDALARQRVGAGRRVGPQAQPQRRGVAAYDLGGGQAEDRVGGPVERLDAATIVDRDDPPAAVSRIVRRRCSPS